MAKNIEFIENTERIEALEENFGIRLEGLSAKVKYSSYSSYIVSGDVFATNGTTIDRDIELVMSCHDAAGRVLVHGKHLIEAKSFSGIDTFSEQFFYYLLPFVTVDKIRVYPKIA